MNILKDIFKSSDENKFKGTKSIYTTKKKRYYNLNIETILENWEVWMAIQEIISNAIDESKLSNTKSPKIFKDWNKWIIKDYCRGLKSDHFSQNENDEKK